MITTRLHTDDLPRPDRFTWWHDMTVATLLPTVLRTARADDFRATADILDLGAAQITTMSYLPVTSTRTPELIRQRDPEYWQLSLTLRGTMTLSQARNDTVLHAGDLALYDSSRPFGGETRCDDGAVRHVVAHLPKAALPVRPDLVDRLLATRLTGDQGFGALLVHFLTQVTTKAGHYRPTDAARLSTVLTDLLAATVAQHLDRPGVPPPDTRGHALLLHVRAFILQRLDDPGLSPAGIAAAHHISLRTLHRLFQQQDTTVAAFIRHQRLEHARRDLADPLLAPRPIHATAARWGFAHPSDFTRAFRTAYGTTPRDYRRAAHAAHGTTGRPEGTRGAPGWPSDQDRPTVPPRVPPTTVARS
ncbi:helix-turn-helix domain-containing protein [Streptomyces fumanus]|uniref:AraC family transcriptional regulator n=1 Tax=Streptomyces fumanus TaxID=67302 RepID=A0A919DWP3_9ACTN|nr:helix-turn-helix domain-containing protein [Streptomyces fumanus]GHE92509.1 AraC family transcriptional regulator [Streptomyces fumanus]